MAASDRDEEATEPRAVGELPSTPSPQRATDVAEVSPLSAEEEQKGLEAMRGLFEKIAIAAGVDVSVSWQERLDQGIQSDDDLQIRNAIREVLYEQFLPPARLSAAFGRYVKHPNPLVRFLVGDALLRIGDDSGADVLRALVREPAAIPVREEKVVVAVGRPQRKRTGQNDLRFRAARTLAQFRQTQAAEDVLALKERSGGGVPSEMFGKLGLPHLVREAGQKYTKFPDGGPKTLILLGIYEARQFAADLDVVFRGSKSFDRRTAAAWALYELTEQEEYLDFLVEAARDAIDRRQRPAGGIDSHVIRYLGSIDRPEVDEVLVAALGSQKYLVQSSALVNLTLNRREPHPAALAKLRERTGVGVELRRNVAGALKDPEIDEIIRRDAGGPGPILWRWEARKDWSPYVWIDDYVLKLLYPLKDARG